MAASSTAASSTAASSMAASSDLWEELGNLPPEELFSVLTQLFTRYEQELRQEGTAERAGHFFKLLATTIAQTRNCNLNRR